MLQDSALNVSFKASASVSLSQVEMMKWKQVDAGCILRCMHSKPEVPSKFVYKENRITISDV